MLDCFCPICGSAVATFGFEGATTIPGRCPNCRSLARTRLLWLYYRDETRVLHEHLRVLHFAPERSLQPRFAALGHWQYVTTDLVKPDVALHMDVTDQFFRDGVFDFIMFNHVLEHIHDDTAALTELRRVLKPGGWMMLTVPLNKRAQTTEFCPATEARPLDDFRPDEHVRYYGWDLALRLESLGYCIETDRYAQRLTPEDVRRHGVKDDVLFICRKAAD